LSAARAQYYRWHCERDTGRLLDTMCSRIETMANTAVRERGVFSMVLAGGKTPQPLYQRLKNLQTDWSCWQIYFGDERCFSVGHPDRNDTQARQAWLNHVLLPPGNIHSIPAETLERGAADYAVVIARAGRFDLVLLGLGEDGHTAALFPGDPAGLRADAAAVIYISNSPKPPSQRISLSVNSLGNSRALWLLATGASKKIALQRLHTDVQDPVSYIKTENGVDIFTDQLFV
jgi:6-phosphogluconolactonase